MDSRGPPPPFTLLPEPLTQHHVHVIGSFLAGSAWAFVAMCQWRRGNFMNTHNCSLNVIERCSVGDKKWRMHFRTLYEKPLLDVLGQNKYAASLVTRQARWHRRSIKWHWRRMPSTKDATPFFVLASQDDQKSVLKCVVNHLSEQFAEGYVAHSMGLPVQRGWYVVGLTCEEDSWFVKTRSMVVREDVLAEIALMDHADFTLFTVHLENPGYHQRLRTIRQMALDYHRRPSDFALVELCVRTGGTSSPEAPPPRGGEDIDAFWETFGVQESKK